MRLRAAAAVVLAGGLVAGCADAGVTPPPAESRVDVDTPQLRRAKAEARIAPCPPTEQAGSDLPEITLECLGGGQDVRLDGVKGPAVLPLWASWCEPCKRELPYFARLAEEAGDRLTVLGIDYQDTRPEAGIELLRTSGARFPQLADPGGTLADSYRVRGLPGVLWVEEDGTARFVNAQIHSYGDLVDLVSDELAITVGGAG